MKPIQSTSYSIHFQEDAYANLTSFLRHTEYSKVVILVDNNTHTYCLPKFKEHFPKDLSFEIVRIPAGEEHKTIDTCTQVWQDLTDLQADRKSLLINLGGGMVTDLGGFVASTFKRGIDFINIPTTLLGMVDASVGSKTGVDLGTLKNLIGCFCDPQMVIVDTAFLKTLTDRDFRSGLAEIIKYGLTYDAALWEQLKTNSLSEATLNEIIHRSVDIKNTIVLKDLKETSLRKILNFGHTIGHAIESYFLEHPNKNALTHGEAIGIGMVIEAYSSHKLLGFPEKELHQLKEKVIGLYGQTTINESEYGAILNLMKHDKKNLGSTINFVLLKAVASFDIDCQVPQELLVEGIGYYSR